MAKTYHIALVGATGAVGQEILRLLEKRGFPVASLRCFASERSSGKKIPFKGDFVEIEKLEEKSFAGIDLALFCAGGQVSREYIPWAQEAGAVVIDSSSVFRQDPEVPLVIPEINCQALVRHKGIISSPNCTTTLMLLALAPLHREWGIKRIVVSTYQAASGAGALAMRELEAETRAFLQKEAFTRSVMPFPYAFNLFLHNSSRDEMGYAEEERKMIYETRKILEAPEIQVNATCVRVPVLRAHSQAVNVEFINPYSLKQVYALLEKAPGLTLWEDKANNRFPMPIDATGQELVFCGRIRQDLSHPQALDLWIVGDQLLKGAALNAVQIAENL